MRGCVVHKSQVPTSNVTISGQTSNPVSAITLNLWKKILSNFIKKLTIISRYMYVTHNIYMPNLKVRVTIWVQRSKYVSAITQKSTTANFIKLHRRIYVPTLKVKVTIWGQRSKYLISDPRLSFYEVSTTLWR